MSDWGRGKGNALGSITYQADLKETSKMEQQQQQKRGDQVRKFTAKRRRNWSPLQREQRNRPYHTGRKRETSDRDNKPVKRQQQEM